MTLREEGFGELLPSAQAVVVDEAHALPELAAQAFGHTISSRQLRDLARDAARATGREAPDMPDLVRAVRELEGTTQGALGEFSRFQGRQDLPPPGHDPGCEHAIQRITGSLGRLAEALAAADARGPELAACARRAAHLQARLAEFAHDGASDRVLWLEAGARGFVLHATPLGVATQFRERVERSGASWIFCSATLAVDSDFGHFQHELGLEDVPAMIWDSPFDFARQTLRYLPRLPVMPNEPGYLEAVTALASDVIRLCGGRTFLLCTSQRALGHYAAPLREVLPYPVLVQGEQPRAALLDSFVQLGNAVLIGTSTFWEGVDVRGEALSCVIIDKLPFAPPGDPLLRARSRRLAELGRDAFRDYQLPVAALTLKQGAGRLIRDPADRGVLVLCDPRLRSRGYGRIFLRALPAMPETSVLADVADFFRRVPDRAGAGRAQER
jgi:ATP-dependent DNA helicase DinG